MHNQHKYDPEHAGWLDNPLRRRLLPQGEMLAAAAPRPDAIWADIGCGTGFYTVPLAKRVKKVYALDISIKMLGMLKEKIALAGITNIEPLLSQENLLPLPDNSVEGIFLAFVAHELSEPEHFFAELGRILNSKGCLFIVEFAKKGFSLGPPRRERLEKERVDRWAADAGLEASSAYGWSKSLLGWKYVDTVGWKYLKS